MLILQTNVLFQAQYFIIYNEAFLILQLLHFSLHLLQLLHSRSVD